MKRFALLTASTALVALFLSASALSSESDRALQNSVRSFAPATSQVHQLVALLQAGIEQADIDLLLSLFTTANDEAQMRYFTSDVVGPLTDFFVGACSPDSRWQQTAFGGFCVLVDSISMTQNTAIVRLRAIWLSDSTPHRFDLAMARNGSKWYITSFATVLDLLENFLRYSMGLSHRSEPTLTGKRDMYSINDAAESDYLLNQTSIWTTPSMPRMNRFASRNRIQEGVDILGCATSVSTYIQVDGGDFSRDLMAVSDECWRRILVLDDRSEFLVGVGRRGTGNTIQDFAAPQGLEFMGPALIYVTEDYNNRIKVVKVNAAGNDKLYLYDIITLPELNRPVDLDVTLPNEFGERTAIVANSGANNILLFDDEEPWGAHNVRIHAGGGSVGALVKPISVAFGRDPLTSVKNNLAYLIDSGGKRIVRIQNWNNTTPGYTAYSDFPDPHTNLSCIAVDNKGEVWAVDKGLGKIYKFTKDLVPIAKHGYLGTADGEYLHPTSISFTQGWDYNTGQPLSNLGEVVLAEEWTDDTGIRRLVPGTEIFDETIVFRPKLSSSLAAVHGGYFITGYSNITEELIDPSGNTVDSHQRLMVASGQQSYWFYLSPSLPSGTYQLRVMAASIYTNSNTDITTMSVAVDNSLVNQPPVVTNIWLPDGDSCFIMDVPKWIRATAYDPDGSISTYQWQVTEPGSGDVDYIQGDSLFFESHYTNAKAPGDDSYLQVRAVDNYGEASASAYFLKFSKLTVYYAYDCICTWMPGDANFSHSYSISDIVHITNFVFAGGPAPQPVHLAGDADCLSGGPPVQCTCSDY